MERVRDHQVAGAPWDQSAIFPDTSFNCTGTIRNLTFGANNRSSGTVFPELQLWRPSGNSNNYDFVRRITFNESNQIFSLIYQLNGTSIPFEEGDVLGFYQPSRDDSKSRIQLAVRMPQPVQTMYRRGGNMSTVFTASGDSLPRNPMVSVVTDPPNCASGFMSLETLQTLVGLGDIGRLVIRGIHQQITPDINFTCDGVITKWLVGGGWVNDSSLIPGPELQLWRKTTINTYTKINGTFVTSSVSSDNGIFNDSSFSPIPFQAGDILGIFVPRSGSTRLRLRFELSRGPLNYYTVISPSTANTSPHTEFQLSDFTTSQVYRPLVSVEISVSESTTTHVQLIPTSSLLVPMAAPSTSQSSPVPSTESSNQSAAVAAGVGTGVPVFLVLLIAVLLVVILVFLWGRKKREKPVASSEQEHEYYEVKATGNDQQYRDNKNEMYNSIGSGRVTTNLQQGDVPLASNQAYGVLQHEDYEVETTGNEQENEDYENEMYNSIASGRVTTNLQQGEVAVASNQAYGVFET